MSGNLVWSLVLAGVGIFGLYLAGSKNKWGWTVGLFAQILWFVFAIATKQYGFTVSAMAYGWVYARNYIRWRNDKRKEESS